MAYAVGKDAFPDYAHRFSPKKFTQPQLFACLVPKVWLKTDYRGVVGFLSDCADLRQVIDLEAVPHFTTLHKASRRLLCQKHVQGLLQATVARSMARRRTIDLAAADSSGFEATHASRYYVWRAKQLGSPPKHMTYRYFPKLGIICDVATHMILAIHPTRGPSPDVGQLSHLLKRLCRGFRVRCLVADAGYDSEPNHVLLREKYHIHSIIPPLLGRPTKKLPTGHYRRLMKTRFDERRYRQRPQAETTVSMIKRNLGSCLSTRTHWSKIREMSLKSLAHNIAILLALRGFLQSLSERFSGHHERSR